MFTSGAGITCASWCKVRWRMVSHTVTKSFSSPAQPQVPPPHSHVAVDGGHHAVLFGQALLGPRLDDAVAPLALFVAGDIGDSHACADPRAVSDKPRGARRRAPRRWPAARRRPGPRCSAGPTTAARWPCARRPADRRGPSIPPAAKAGRHGRIDQVAGVAVVDQRGEPPHRSGHHRRAAGGRFEGHQPEGLRRGWAPGTRRRRGSRSIAARGVGALRSARHRTAS